MKYIPLNSCLVLLALTLAFTNAKAQDVDLPDISVPETSAEEQPVEQTDVLQVDSLVKEVFAEEPADGNSPAAPAPAQTEQPVQKTEDTVATVVEAKQEQVITQEAVKPNFNYAKVELAVKPEYTEMVTIEAPKPIDEIASPKIAEIKIDASAAKKEQKVTPEFSGLPKSMIKDQGASKIVDVAEVPVIPLDTVPQDELAVLNQLTKLPPEKRDFVVNKTVTVERGTFNDPFYEELETPEADASNLGSIENGIGEVAVNVNKNNLDELKDKKTEKDEDKKIPKSLTRSEFFVKDKSLNIEVKKQSSEIAKNKKNAYDALNLGMYESAIGYYKRVLEENPNDKNAMFGLATSYHKAKQYEKAKTAYLELIKRDKNFFPAINNYIILVTERNPDRAIEKLAELWKKNPDFPAIPAQIASLYYKKNNFQKAVEYYMQAISLDPDNLEYKYNVAVILEKAGESKLAARYYKNLLDEAAKGRELPEDPLTIRDRFFFLMSDKG